jgi:hypothetical protein
MPTVQLFNGDCVALLTEGLQPYGDVPTTMKMAGRLKADACVTDPPYGFDFAGEKEWDTFEDSRSCTTAADDARSSPSSPRGGRTSLRMNVLKPGSHLLAFTAGPYDRPGGPRAARAPGTTSPAALLALRLGPGQEPERHPARLRADLRRPRDRRKQNLTKLFKDKGRPSARCTRRRGRPRTASTRPTS